MTSAEIRASFIDFFERRGHRPVHSSPLVPANDPTLLFTNAGMNQFKDVFLGKERREYARAVTAQKCMRVSGKHNDLENVGPSLRHHTFFEMLGNFSFGDYFKEEAVDFAWTLLTEVWRIPPDRLIASIFRGDASVPRDDEAARVWRRYLPEDRIVELGADDNFWAMGDVGPCGRCSEIYYVRGEDVSCPEPVCRGLDCSCDRYMEIWNNVFMEFNRDADNVLHPLPAPSIDTGMGLERISAVLQSKLSNYDTDLFTPILDAIAAQSRAAYGAAAASDVSMRVIADHLRAMTFLIADGVTPSNEFRGYVLRKIMRRAMRHGMLLNAPTPFLHALVPTVVEAYGAAYPELRDRASHVTNLVSMEEQRFETVLQKGGVAVENLARARLSQGRPVTGEDVFRLYDSLGVPPDYTEDVLASSYGLTFDRAGFDAAMKAQRDRGRAAGAFDPRAQDAFQFETDADRAALEQQDDRFEGYTAVRVDDARVTALFDADRRQVDALPAGVAGLVALDRTPFYVEAGGQVSDIGRLSAPDGSSEAVVSGMQRLPNGAVRLHVVRVERGELRAGDLVSAQVDADVRDAIRRNHTATHLLHAALRTTLGTHVKQEGSLVAPDRLRFDFAHLGSVGDEQLATIERLVNEQIYRNAPVETEVRSVQDAIAGGAMALFGEKYGERVRVVTIAGFSVELCGGTHCRATGDIGPFIITEESGTSAGVRRIVALTGAPAVREFQRDRALLRDVSEALNTPEESAADTVRRLQGDLKRVTREAADLRLKVAMGGGAAAAHDDVFEVDGVRVVARRAPQLGKSELRSLADSLRDQLKAGVVVVGTEAGDKVSFVVSVRQDLTPRLHAGNIVKELAPLVGGRGGGRPEFAEAGGKDTSKLDALLDASRDTVARMLAS